MSWFSIQYSSSHWKFEVLKIGLGKKHSQGEYTVEIGQLLSVHYGERELDSHLS